ncbi:contact-dependent growth inhibition system immunity protein [Pseudomonas syringae group genomosp. 3]|uniref:contact-dependent growth inhibition system immunity protein n=1 Tax=Pseudomonas syringae group genomosp. 3 TaxID=251701 RepID=UPI001EE9F1E9|nr:contact-dependent growth inhibition system immunity protein [Pseudomonas syringae group genomosp. 3]
MDSNHALEEIVKCESASCLRDSVKEIEHLLSQPMTETDYSELMASTVGCYFEPSSEHTHYSDWLSKIAIYFKSQR